MQKLTASSRWSNFTHKDTEKNRKSQNFKIVLNRRETDSRVSLAQIRGQKSLKFENDGMGTGLKVTRDYFSFSFLYYIHLTFQQMFNPSTHYFIIMFRMAGAGDVTVPQLFTELQKSIQKNDHKSEVYI